MWTLSIVLGVFKQFDLKTLKNTDAVQDNILVMVIHNRQGPPDLTWVRQFKDMS
jgi:hypothetical protein